MGIVAASGRSQPLFCNGPLRSTWGCGVGVGAPPPGCSVLRYAPDGSGPTVIKGGLAERWSDRPITKIHPHDIWAVVDEARRLGVPGLERRAIARTDPLGRVMLACLSSFFGWLKKNRRIERNPCAGIDRPDASPPRDRVLTEAEIVRFGGRKIVRSARWPGTRCRDTAVLRLGSYGNGMTGPEGSRRVALRRCFPQQSRDQSFRHGR
jgi:hypothetical protein